MQPRAEALRVTQPREFAPGEEECLLDGVLRSIRVAKDPIRDRVAQVAVEVDEFGEGDVVALSRPFDQPRPHGRCSLGARAGASPTTDGRTAEKVHCQSTCGIGAFAERTPPAASRRSPPNGFPTRPSWIGAQTTSMCSLSRDPRGARAKRVLQGTTPTADTRPVAGGVGCADHQRRRAWPGIMVGMTDQPQRPAPPPGLRRPPLPPRRRARPSTARSSTSHHRWRPRPSRGPDSTG